MVAAHKARTDVNNVSSMGRDGSGIRMMMWAGATMEAGPRAGQAADINSRPSFPFGGIWPIFGNDGKRFFNETITRHGSVGYLDMMPEGQKMPYITHGFLRADSRNSMGFILLYGKKNVSRYGFRHSVLEPHAARCAMSSCSAARAGICWTMLLPRPSWPRRMNC